MEFFNKVKNTFTDTSKIVAQKAKEVAEITKLKNQIAVEENKIQASYVAIGKRFYEESTGEVSEEYIHDFTIINDSKAKIHTYTEQLKIIKKVYNCPNCGTEIAVESSFCSACGQKLNPPILSDLKTEQTDDVVVEPKSTEG